MGQTEWCGHRQVLRDSCDSAASDPTLDYRESFEATIVRVALAFALIVLAGCFGFLLPHVRARREANASDLVRELEEAGMMHGYRCVIHMYLSVALPLGGRASMDGCVGSGAYTACSVSDLQT